jgi:hypothetical protein
MAFIFSVQALAAETPAPDAEDITVTNNLTGMPDTVAVEDVPSGGIVKVYGTATGSTPIGVTVSDGGTAVVSVYQLGISAEAFMSRSQQAVRTRARARRKRMMPSLRRRTPPVSRLSIMPRVFPMWSRCRAWPLLILSGFIKTRPPLCPWRRS